MREKNEVVTLDMLERELATKPLNVREAEAEEANMFLVTYKNKSDVISSEWGKTLSGSLMNRVSRYFNQLSQEERDVSSLLVNLDNTYEEFKAYLLGKVKGKQKEDYNSAFRDADFKNDTINLLVLQAFHHKQDRQRQGYSLFFSKEVQKLHSLATAIRNDRQLMHEASARIAKTTLTLANGSKEALSDAQAEQVEAMIQSTMGNLLDDQLHRIAEHKVIEIEG